MRAIQATQLKNFFQPQKNLLYFPQSKQLFESFWKKQSLGSLKNFLYLPSKKNSFYIPNKPNIFSLFKIIDQLTCSKFLMLSQKNKFPKLKTFLTLTRAGKLICSMFLILIWKKQFLILTEKVKKLHLVVFLSTFLLFFI